MNTPDTAASLALKLKWISQQFARDLPNLASAERQRREKELADAERALRERMAQDADDSGPGAVPWN